MTPTEQDKEQREQIHSALFADDFPILNDIERDAVDRIIAIIQAKKADSKRVALEARIDELKMWELPENEIQMVFANPCNICGHDYPKLRKAQQDRLSALKAQQEEV